MKQAYNRTRLSKADDGGMFPAGEMPVDDELAYRLGQQVNEFSSIDRIEHVKAICRVVQKAQPSVYDRGRRRTLGQVHAPTASEGDRL